jgi:hypothetical protein
MKSAPEAEFGRLDTRRSRHPAQFRGFGGCCSCAPEALRARQNIKRPIAVTTIEGPSQLALAITDRSCRKRHRVFRRPPY